MTAVQQPVPVQVSYGTHGTHGTHETHDTLSKNDSSHGNEGSSSSVSSTSSVSVPSRPVPAFHRSASSPSMNHCWQLKTSLNAGITPLQPLIKEIKTGSKDDTDISPEDIIVDPKTHHTYRKGRLIGKGGFAKVYEVTRLCATGPTFEDGISEIMADKIIDKEVFSRRSTSKDKVKREILLHKDLIHPNVVRFHNFFSDADGNIHILLEYCSQKSLLHVMKNRKVLTEPEVRYYMVQICEGVRYLHRKTILHRDLKLGNMFLTWDMTVKIGDFGLATQHQASISSVSTLCGTPNYIAPEVLKKQGHGYEADVWALGCMMFAMLVGTPPFETKSLGRTYAKIAANEYEIPERLSPSAKTFIAMLLNPEPKNRGHLHHSGHPFDVLSHTFFQCGFSPRKLPQSAVSQAPTFPLDTVLSNGNSAENIDVPDNNQNNNINSKFRLMKKLSSCLLPLPTTGNSCHSTGKFQDHAYDVLGSSNIGPNQNSTQQYRPADHLISHIIDVLEQWISRRPQLANHETDLLLSPISVVPIFVSKWIDYSNKYGFGYQLSDKTVGVLFNEGTRICQTMMDEECFEFTDVVGKSVAWRSASPPPSFIDLSSKLKLLDYFVRYMDENLAEGVILSLCANQMRVSTRHRSVIPQVVRWTRNQSAVIMELNNGSVQINFIRDHAKVIFWGVDNNNCGLLLTYMATDKAPITYNLRSLPRLMTNTPNSPLLIIDQKISQSLIVLRELAQNLQSSR